MKNLAYRCAFGAFSAAIASAFMGCAILPSPPSQPAGPTWTLDDVLAETAVVCKGAEQCAAYWRRTQYWISTHSGFKIQLATDTAIDTYNAPVYSRSWAYSARREPGLDGSDRITISPSCSRAPLCQESPASMVRQAQQYITGN